MLRVPLVGEARQMTLLCVVVAKTGLVKKLQDQIALGIFYAFTASLVQLSLRVDREASAAKRLL